MPLPRIIEKIRLHQSRFSGWQFASQHLPIANAEHSSFASVFGMQVGHMMLPIVKEIYANHDAIEHGQDGHGRFASKDTWANYTLNCGFCPVGDLEKINRPVP
jgi:hypothetical protein